MMPDQDFLAEMFRVFDLLDDSNFEPALSTDEPYLAALVARGLAETDGKGYRRTFNAAVEREKRRTDPPSTVRKIKESSARIKLSSPSIPILDLSLVACDPDIDVSVDIDADTDTIRESDLITQVERILKV